jgi:hypothetical protein
MFLLVVCGCFKSGVSLEAEVLFLLILMFVISL